MNRGARQAPIFHSDHDCVSFLGLVADLPRLFGVEVHAYALMPNHFHLMLVGPVFRGRYRNRLVEDERYWAHLLSYLHLNPVKARLAPTPAEARWTSCRAYYGLETRPDWLKTEDLLDAFLGPAGLSEYTQAQQVGREGAPDGFDEEHLWTRPSSGALPPPPTPPPRAGRSCALWRASARRAGGGR